jgi:hypothetical protein
MLFKRNKDAKRSLFRKTINGFIYTGVGLLILLVILFGVSQTSTFRNWLREKIITEFNDASNSKLYIEEIDGTLLTSLIIDNSNLTLDGDTLFMAEKIEVKTSPLKILFKLIYFRDVEVTNCNISLLKDAQGEINISKLFPPSEEPPDTTSSSFNWKIQVANLELSNINFKLQSADNKNSTQVYSQPNFDDLRVNDLNLSLAGFADLSESEFHLSIANLDMHPNLTGFNLKHFEVNINKVGDRAEINDLHLITSRSDVLINASVSEYAFLDPKEKRKFENAVLDLNLVADKFDFDDLSNWISGTQLLNGKVGTNISVSGTLSELYLNKLNVNYNQGTILKGEGQLKNILAGADMQINMLFTNSQVNQEDVNNLLRDIEIPVYPGYGLLRLDTISYSGKPLNFNSHIILNTDKGSVNLSADLDLEKEDMEYNINFVTQGLDVQPVSGLQTNLNSAGSIQGSGTDLKTLKTNIDIKNSNSTVSEYYLNNFALICTASDGKINADVNIVSDSLKGSLKANLDFNNPDLPAYNFSGNIQQLNISKFLYSDNLNTKLNFVIDGEGTSFDPDEMNLFFSLRVDSSYLNDIYIKSTRTIVDLRKDENERVINLISDLADITVEGNFNTEDLIELITKKSGLIAESVTNKLNSFNGQAENRDSSYYYSNSIQPETDLEENLTSDIDVKYLIEFKDFELISLFLGNADLEVDGEIGGDITSKNNELNMSMNTKIDYFKYWDGNNLLFTSETNLDFSIQDSTSTSDLDNLVTNMHLTSKRMFVGAELNNITFDLNMKNEDAQIDFSGNFENTASAKLNGNIKFEPNDLRLLLDNLSLNYKGYELENKSGIDIVYKSDEITFNNFELLHKPGEISIEGSMSFSGQQNLNLKASGFEADEITTKLLGLAQDKSLYAIVGLDASLTGTAESPLIDADLSVDSVSFGKTSFGNFNGKAQYSAKLLQAELDFQEFVEQTTERKLLISADVPVNLSFTDGNEVTDKNIVAHLKANDFNLEALGNIVPMVSKLNGLLNADVSITTSGNRTNISGNLNLDGIRFVSDANNLEYELALETVIENNRVNINSLTLNNSHSTQNGGTLTGGGFVTLNNFTPDQVEIFMNGELLLLNKNSRAVSPNIYGDVKIRTNGNIEFKLAGEKSSLDADITLTHGTNINVIPFQNAFSNGSDQFKYRFIDFSVDNNKKDTELDSLIVLTESKNRDSNAASKTSLDLNVKIAVEDEAKMILVLSREFNQNLTAYLGGNFQYTTINNTPQASGELKLLEGSKLEFIKTFDAEGSIKFFSDLDNPFLDVTASYTNFYSPLSDSTQSGSNEEEVLIQIKLEGPLKSLNTNLMKNESSISVYKRASNRGQFELDQTKTVSDAMMFIIVGKFADEATAQETNLAASTAVSLAGSMVGGVLNQAFGDIVRGFQLRQVGQTTKFSLIGKVPTPFGEVRYEVGGTSQVFQDLGRANVRLEVPPFKILPSLIFRIERREPIFESSTSGEMINEVGVKYSFEF